MAKLEDFRVDPGSFKDPAGVVFHNNGRIFRALSARGVKAFEIVCSSGVLKRWEARGLCVTTQVVDTQIAPQAIVESIPFKIEQVLEHERIHHISYPYEWPFELLKRAALLQLSLHIEALESGLTFSDSSAYNVQFKGSVPVFIDIMSLCPYVEGDYWQGYRQFCEQFLNPLLLTAKLGVDYAAWYRGQLHGIGVEETAKVLPLSAKLTLNMLSHVSLHAALTKRVKKGDDRQLQAQKKLPKRNLMALLSGMHNWVAKLQPLGIKETFWADYASNNSYSPELEASKKDIISEFIRTSQPSTVFDLGCNSGEYGEVALKAGAKSVVGFDFDQGALAAAVSRASAKNLNILPLYLDISNPSASQGWLQQERQGFVERFQADAIIALALIHHLAIGRNVPLPQAVKWLVELAPTGIIEFVPKSDPMVVGMLSSREDIFDDYNREGFKRALSKVAKIVTATDLTPDGRVLFRYARTA